MSLFQGAARERIQKRQIEGEIQVDFTGGLRLVDEGEPIDRNQLRECTNMFPQPSGGIERRPGIMPFAGLAAPARARGAVMEYVRSTGEVELLIEDSTGRVSIVRPGVERVDLGNVIGAVTDGPLRGVQIGAYLYLGRPQQLWRRYDGTTFTLIPSAVRLDAENFAGTGLPDFSTFTRPGIPRGHLIQVWNGRTWVAGAEIGADQNDAAVHFSFSFGVGDREGQEDFYENWGYVFEPPGRDKVQAMVPLGDRMFVFLKNSVHSLTPYLGERLSLFYDVQRFESRVGAVGRNAVVASPDAVWFYDREEGLMRVGADGTLSSHMTQIEKLKDKLIPDLQGVSLGYWDDKVYLAVPEKLGAATPTTNTRIYVYDTKLDSWSMIPLEMVGFHAYRPTDPLQPQGTLVGLSATLSAAADMGHDNDHGSDHFTDTLSFSILGSFSTTWFDSEVPEAVKDWRGAEVVYRSKSGQQIRQTAVIDWNPHQVGGRWLQDVANSAAWDDGNTGPAGWTNIGLGIVEPFYAFTSPPSYPGYQENNVVDVTLVDRTPRFGEISGPSVGTATKLAKPIRTSRICSSRALSMEFKELASSGRWGVDRITLYYSRKPIRI